MPEILISASLLLVLTAVALATLMPVWRRQDRFQNADDHVRGFLVAREALHGRLARARVRAVAPARLTFLYPKQIQTNHGSVSRLLAGESVEYDPTEHAVVFEDGRLKYDEQILWRVGAGSRMWLEEFGEDNLFVRFHFEGREDPARDDSPLWRRSFALFLPNRER